MCCFIARAMPAAILIAFSLSKIAPVTAQDTTQTLSGKATSKNGTPPAGDCIINRAEVADIVDALRQPLSGSELASFPIVTPSETDLPTGGEPNEEELDAVSAAMWTAIACHNAGDFPRFFACFSPRGIMVLSKE